MALERGGDKLHQTLAASIERHGLTPNSEMKMEGSGPMQEILTDFQHPQKTPRDILILLFNHLFIIGQHTGTVVHMHVCDMAHTYK